MIIVIEIVDFFNTYNIVQYKKYFYVQKFGKNGFNSNGTNLIRFEKKILFMYFERRF